MQYVYESSVCFHLMQLEILRHDPLLQEPANSQMMYIDVNRWRHDAGFDSWVGNGGCGKNARCCIVTTRRNSSKTWDLAYLWQVFLRMSPVVWCKSFWLNVENLRLIEVEWRIHMLVYYAVIGPGHEPSTSVETRVYWPGYRSPCQSRRGVSPEWDDPLFCQVVT